MFWQILSAQTEEYTEGLNKLDGVRGSEEDLHNCWEGKHMKDITQ